MESNSTHQVATEGAGGSSPTVITIPRWIEARDRRPGAERFDPSRSRYYVVSPMLSPADATTLANAYAQRERLERAHLALERLQTPVLVGVMVALVFLIVQEYSYWTLLLPALVFAGHQFMYQDAANELRKPFDTAALEEHADTRMFHRIPVNEYQAATRIAKNNDVKSLEVHQFMWRAYELQALYQRTQEDFHRILATENLSEPEIRSIQAKLAALQELARDAHQALFSVLNPRRHVLPTGREGLLELVHRVDAALQEGIQDLDLRVAEANAVLTEVKRARDHGSATSAKTPRTTASAQSADIAAEKTQTTVTKMINSSVPRPNVADQLLREATQAKDLALQIPVTAQGEMLSQISTEHLLVQDSVGYTPAPISKASKDEASGNENTFSPIERWFPHPERQDAGGAITPVGSASARRITPNYDTPPINHAARTKNQP